MTIAGIPCPRAVLAAALACLTALCSAAAGADLARLKKYLTPRGKDPSRLRTRAYALEALARRTRRDTRCDGGRRLTDAAAAAAWAAAHQRE
jgi:hypothetical protein